MVVGADDDDAGVGHECEGMDIVCWLVVACMWLVVSEPLDSGPKLIT